jgi:hypothetical protein
MKGASELDLTGYAIGWPWTHPVARLPEGWARTDPQAEASNG